MVDGWKAEVGSFTSDILVWAWEWRRFRKEIESIFRGDDGRVSMTSNRYWTWYLEMSSLL